MRQFDGVIFDMDGTLIEPLLDFGAIRDELGVSPQDGIVETIESMPAGDREKARRLLLDHELSAARRAGLMPGASSAVRAVRSAGLKTALLTRNSARAMEIVLRRFGNLHFDLTWSREDGPIKPEPDGVLRACNELGIQPERTACVGDFHYDITAANAAGAISILLVPADRPVWADEADHVISTLSQLPGILGI